LNWRPAKSSAPNTNTDMDLKEANRYEFQITNESF